MTFVITRSVPIAAAMHFMMLNWKMNNYVVYMRGWNSKTTHKTETCILTSPKWNYYAARVSRMVIK